MTAPSTATLKRKCNSAWITFLELATTLVLPSAPRRQTSCTSLHREICITSHTSLWMTSHGGKHPLQRSQHWRERNSSYMVSSATENDHLVRKTLKSFNIDVTNWEVCAQDRPLWRSMIQTGARTAETNRIAEAQKKRTARKARLLYHQHFSRPDIPMHRVWKNAAGPIWTD